MIKMNLFTFLMICLAISSSEAAPTQRGQADKHHREDLTLEPSVDEHEPKDAGGNLQEEQEKRRQVVREVKDLLKQLSHLGRWSVKVKTKRARDADEGETSRQNWKSEIQPRDSQAGLHDNSHGTLISKGW